MTTQLPRLMFCNGTDMFYATGMKVSSARIWYQNATGATTFVASALEYAEAQEKCKTDQILSLDGVAKENNLKPSFLEVMLCLLQQDGVTEVEIPDDFPAIAMKLLQDNGINVVIAKGEFLSRSVKSAEEIEKLYEAQQANQKAVALARQVLVESTISDDGFLIYEGEVLTSEKMHVIMRKELLVQGFVDFGGGPIVSCGENILHTHSIGSGPLRAGEFILIDCYPKHGNGYWGDLTRTYIKGKPTAEQSKLYDTVLKGQELGISLLRPGANSREIHKAIHALFAEAGYETDYASKPPKGFTHATGHSIGLEVHDGDPRLNDNSETIMQEGHAVTIEPGLYYEGIGGVRIEDSMAVTADGVRNFTTISKTYWIIE